MSESQELSGNQSAGNRVNNFCLDFLNNFCFPGLYIQHHLIFQIINDSLTAQLHAISMSCLSWFPAINGACRSLFVLNLK